MSLPPPHAEGPTIPQIHQALVDLLIKNDCITTAAVEAAFRAVPRHLFLPSMPPEHVYQDQAIPTKYAEGRALSSSSQPTIMATMLEQLALASGHRVLEIGAGTGYNAALIAHIVGDTGQVITIDVDEDIVAQARDHLAAAGFNQVTVVEGDGAFGYPPSAPYDRIILTVGAWDITPAWEEQLAPQGRLVLPLTLLPSLMLSVAVERVDQGLQSVSATPCFFMPLRGAHAHPRTWEWAQPSVRMYPKALQHPVGTNEIGIMKDWHQMIIRWPQYGSV
jgi:methyltransferase of FxLD system